MPKKILIVDDDPEIVKLLAKRLKVAGYETYIANDSYQCVHMAQTVRPDLILLDVKMPAGGGINAFQILKSSTFTSTIPIIFISAFFGEYGKNIKELDAEGYFAKPFDGTKLQHKIWELLGE